ncbi:hypothetical protein RHSIM_Rhsim08G0213500 [Rhododendron simsii]|uniref:Phytocyanin domain-containing protein n=1 Tax=Rhododendron simsii TaxID=118357 RepID=A0A834LHC9_RHOSS|nr:hypothetical protein RHSIM_Rhsim08G0213500 [Rhododendron simsii]
MERNMRMVVVALFGVVAAVMLQCAAAQTAHVVGDSSGWIVPPNGAQAYVSWASDKTFVVGDTLIFNFATNAHDVLQVTKDSYDACTDTNPIGNPITTGPANVTLTTAGDHYYICTYGRHCASGQKLTITVSATGTPGAAPPPSTTAAPPPPPPSTPSPTSSTTPEACAPEPSATPPSASGPTTSTTPGQVTPPPPDSSSPAVSGGDTAEKYIYIYIYIYIYMERNMRMVVALFGVVAAVMLQCAAAQTAHVVGDTSGWIVPPNGAQAYVSWASDKNFVVGDTLIFNFATNAHDVLQVTKDSYDACTDTNPIGNPITTGPANITLTTAGDHYYICTYGRHCASGQKLTITVSTTGTPGAAPPPSTTAPPPPPSTPSPTSSTTPEACAPEPSATNPTANVPTTSTTPGQVPLLPPDSSSPAVSGGFFVTLLSIAMAALF